jgi:hypothetical protein
VKATDASAIALRLGIDETNVRRLQARGYLLSLSFDEPEIRALLLRAHRAYLGGRRSAAFPSDAMKGRRAKLTYRRAWPEASDA